VHELAEPVPAETICRLVGIDGVLVPKVREAALAMFAAQGNPEEFGRRQAVFAALTLPEVHARRTNPRDDYLTLATRTATRRCTPADKNALSTALQRRHTDGRRMSGADCPYVNISLDL
jgi:cytochrome P450